MGAQASPLVPDKKATLRPGTRALEVFRFLRTFGGKPVKFLQQVAKDTKWIEKVHTACREKWGDQPPVGGGSEDYSEEIVELSTSEWLNTEEGEQSPYTPPSADRPQDDAGNLLGHSTQEGERAPVAPPSPTSVERGTTDTDESEQRLGGQIPVTPD